MLLLGQQRGIVTPGEDEFLAIKHGTDKARGLVEDDVAVAPMLDCQRLLQV